MIPTRNSRQSGLTAVWRSPAGKTATLLSANYIGVFRRSSSATGTYEARYRAAHARPDFDSPKVF